MSAAPAQDLEEPRAGQGVPRSTWPLVAVAVLALAALVAAVIQSSRLSDRDAAADRVGAVVAERTEVASVAGALVEALLTYDYRDVEGSLARVQAHTGGEFAELYDETFRVAQVPVITQLQAVATATVQEVFVTEVSDDAAHAVVLVDQTVESTAGLRTLSDTYLRVDLVRRGGRWVVEAIPLRIASVNETITDLPGLTTTTTVPP